MEKNLPHHISNILSELESSGNYEEVLLRYTNLLNKDVSLMQIYLKLGYSLKLNTFESPLKFTQIKKELLQEYSIQQQCIESFFSEPNLMPDNDAEIRQEMLKFFYDQGINEIVSSTDLGLEIPEESSLINLWEDFFPQKRSAQFSTPLPKKIQKCPSTGVSNFLTPTPHHTPNSEDSDMETPRSTRGLRHLTTLVKQLVFRHQPTSFKNVAMKLINELVMADGPERVKEEKNVRRRVYDAINVLIAAGVLARDGRSVFWQQVCDPVEVNQKRKDIDSLKQKVSEKTKGMQSILNKIVAIKHLMQRNACNNSCKPAIQFPFIVLSTPDAHNNSMSIRVNSKATYLRLSFNNAVTIFGDMDILFALNLHKLELYKIAEFLPNRDLLKYCTLEEY